MSTQLGLASTVMQTAIETLRSRFGHLTTNGKPWFAVGGFICLSIFGTEDLGMVARGCQVCFFILSLLF